MIHPEQAAEELQRSLDAADMAAIYARRDRWHRRAENARVRIKKAEKTLDQCYKHFGTRALTEDVAALIARHFRGYQIKVLGPFGLAHETAIHLTDDQDRTVAGVSLRPGKNDRLHLVDWSHNTNRYPSGSIGALNHLNFTVQPDPATVEEIVAVLRAELAENQLSVS